MSYHKVLSKDGVIKGYARIENGQVTAYSDRDEAVRVMGRMQGFSIFQQNGKKYLNASKELGGFGQDLFYDELVSLKLQNKRRLNIQVKKRGQTDIHNSMGQIRNTSGNSREHSEKSSVLSGGQKGKEEMTLYHGSENIIKIPEYGKGKKYNDYGLGFYTTANKGLAGEWAVLSTAKDGYINEYQIDISGLNILNLNKLDVKRWVAILMNNRGGNFDDPAVFRTITAFKRDYLIDINGYDIIIGWRADDSYFNYVEAFASNNLSLESMTNAMKMGNLGNQVCLKSSEAFSLDRIYFVNAYKAEASRFYQTAKLKDKEARSNYAKLLRSDAAIVGTLIRDLV